ncbi:malonyl-ACP O-methyltransferase BioC [Luteimonas sp. MC1825]|uniref:malonyl-ACP O-methyltransferase BioC n=1 Tax=Luteimonas sp. MC1825 TaxID=2761107 RepID=UPI001607FC3E|nr:malonyl-ACP O-methyltransferase BioC [Luteimonas sp. MC1825]MBB6600508.1 malonyl-ACP O-methyltransferase BioC [Luteimonas sp. MC1825]QOC88169.1 malonyl-ACP O-methyltransferase BioC [Luteimonas sp. MC1825]
MTDTFDTRQVRRAFSRAAAGYGAAAALQRDVEARLMESLEYLGERVPDTVVDVGSGPGSAALALRARWPKARVLAVDLALPMLHQLAPRRGWNPLQRRIDRVCADARLLPLADNSVDLLFSNLCVQWVDDLDALFAGFRRVLRPGGMLLCSTFGPDTLHELRAAFAAADDEAHVSPFVPIAGFGDALMRAGFRDPVLDREVEVHGHHDMPALMRELRALGATNALAGRRRALTGRGRFAAAQAAYEEWRGADNLLPATWETITAMAWSPAHGAPIREAGAEIARFPASGIPVRRRTA